MSGMTVWERLRSLFGIRMASPPCPLCQTPNVVLFGEVHIHWSCPNAECRFYHADYQDWLDTECWQPRLDGSRRTLCGGTCVPCKMRALVEREYDDTVRLINE